MRHGHIKSEMAHVLCRVCVQARRVTRVQGEALAVVKISRYVAWAWRALMVLPDSL